MSLPPPVSTEVLTSAAKTLVERLSRGEFAQVAANFKAEFAAGMPVEKLREMWNSVVQRAGAFRGVAEIRPERRGTGDYMMVTCDFAHRQYDMRLLFTDHRTVGDLRFVPTSLRGPGLVRATAATAVRAGDEGQEGVATFPVPGTYRGQVPIDFVVKASPPQALKGYRVFMRDDGINWLCEARVAPPKNGVVVRGEALVLVKDQPVIALPKVSSKDSGGSAALA